MADVSKHKTNLALQVTADLVMALEATVPEVPERLREGFIDLFESMPNKALERLRGLIAGVPVDGAE